MEVSFGNISSATILVPCIIGLIKFKNSVEDYQPFFYLVFVATLTEIFNIICSKLHITNAFFSNIYILIEALLLLYFFYKTTRETKTRKQFYLSISIILTSLWLFDTILLKHINNFSNSYYRIIYLTVLIFIALNRINSIIVTGRKTLWKNSMFIICIGIIICFSYKLIVESMWLFNPYFSNDLLKKAYEIFSVVNIFCNFIFSLALLWVPTKKHFTKPF